VLECSAPQENSPPFQAAVGAYLGEMNATRTASRLVWTRKNGKSAGSRNCGGCELLWSSAPLSAARDSFPAHDRLFGEQRAAHAIQASEAGLPTASSP
jgi:hypothetical protein